MSGQPNRLPADARHFSGNAIDRSGPLHFRLNGQLISGFAGDTVLSAVLASGIAVAGTRGREPLALDERSAPAVVPADRQRELHLALPMDRTPAANGVELATIGARRPTAAPDGPLDVLRHILLGSRRTLGHRFDGISGLDGRWLDAVPEHAIETDVVVVGAGIAGLSAAIAAAKAGSA